MKTILVPIALAVAIALPACSKGSERAGGKLSVVASFYPLAEAARQVGGNAVAVTNLTPPGVEPHDLELTPGQLTSIAESNLVLYLGGGFQPAVQDAVGTAGGTSVDVSADLRTLPVPPGESSGELAADPHVWLDPALFEQVVGSVAKALDRLDPSHTNAFDANAAAYESSLRDLDTAYRNGLATCDRNVIVTSHAAFGYLAARYHLQQVPISGLSPDAEPTPADLSRLQSIVEQDGVTTIFTEELLSPKVAQTLASETGTTTAVLNPLESLTDAEVAAGDTYVSVMQQNLQTLRTALGCH